MNGNQLELLAPAAVTPAPVPCHPAVVPLQMGGQRVVAIQMATPVGVSFYFLSAEIAKEFAKQLEAAAGSGILVVPAGTKIS